MWINKNYGLNFEHKNARIKSYISYYKREIEEGRLIGYTENSKKKEIDKIMKHIIHENQTLGKNYLNMEERIAIAFSSMYIASLNDSEFIQLLQDTKIITDEQRKNLTIQYKDIDNLEKRTYIQEKWKMVQKVQKEASKGDIQK